MFTYIIRFNISNIEAYLFSTAQNRFVRGGRTFIVMAGQVSQMEGPTPNTFVAVPCVERQLAERSERE